MILISGIVLIGCGKDVRPVDANKNGEIDPNDVDILEDKVIHHFNENIQNYLDKAGVKLNWWDGEIPKDIEDKLKDNLTVTEWDELQKQIKEWQRLLEVYEDTKDFYEDNKPKPKPKPDKEICDKIPRPLNLQSGKVRECHVWGQIELENSLLLKLDGIKVPGGGKNRYARTSTDLLKRWIKGRFISYDLPEKNANTVKDAYIWHDDTCINAELVWRGYAIAERGDTKIAKILLCLEQKSRAEKKGLWNYYSNDSLGVDRDRDEVIDEDDVGLLSNDIQDYYRREIEPFLDKGEIDLDPFEGEIPEDIMDRLRDILTVTEWEELSKNLKSGKWEKLIEQYERTKNTVDGIFPEGTPFDYETTR
jgi:hypothetical protein